MLGTKISCSETLKTTSYILSTNGLFFINRITILDVIKIVLNFMYALLIDIIIILNVRNAIKLNNVTLINWMICLLIPMLYYTTKEITLLVNRKCLLSLLKDLNSTVFNGHTEELNRHIRRVQKVSNLMLRCFGITAMMLIFIFCILPFAVEMNLMIPPPFETGRFKVLYKLFHLISITYFGTNAICFDIFYVTLMGLAIAQLNILQERLNRILELAKCIQAKMRNYESLATITARILRDCFVQHQVIIRFTGNLSILGSLPLFVQYICGSFTICNTIMRLTFMGETDASSIMGNLSYCGVIFIEMAAYHWIANEIIYKSDKVVESCYLSTWYDLSIESQKSLLPLMERARRPLIIKLYSFVDVSLASLGLIIRWSYSMFALIKARYS